MATKLWSIILMVLCTLLTSTAQVFWKIAANKLRFSFWPIVYSWHLWVGLCIYAVAAVLMITAFRGGEVSVLYPIIATSYIWVSFLSMIFFNEVITVARWFGISFIILGIMFVSFGSKTRDPAISYEEAV